MMALVPPDNTLVDPPSGDDDMSDLMVQAADQWGPFEVSTRLWNGPAPDPGSEWEDVVELAVSVPTGLIATELVDNDPWIGLLTEPGDYRVRISARGRIAGGVDRAEDEDLEDEEPVEWYLIEAWPAAPAEPAVVRLSSSYAADVLNPPATLVIPEGEAGLAAAGRIGRDVDGKPGARVLSGQTGSVRAERTIRGTRRRLFNWCAHLVSWSHVWVEGSSWGFMGGGPYGGDAYDPAYAHYVDAGNHPDQMSGGRGAIRYYYIEVEKPVRAVRRWEWVVPPPGGDLVMVNRVRFLPESTTMTVELAQSKDDAGDPCTTITITHDNLPVEWLEDMETYWGYQLSIADHADFGIPKK